MTTYLKFNSESDYQEAFEPYLIEDTPPPYIGTSAVDVIGVIHKPTGKKIDTGDGPMPEYAPIPGWHVNLSGSVPELSTFEIDPPATPSRVFAGA